MEKIDSIFQNIKVACNEISYLISNTDPFLNSNIISKNTSGDSVKNLDLKSNDIMINELSKNMNIKYIISEENEKIMNINMKGNYLVTFDPLDGSSNIDSNITIGTIFCIYEINNINLNEIIIGEKIIAAGYCLYGGSTQLILGDKINGIKLYILKDNGNNLKEFTYLKNLEMPKKGKIYAINESNKNRWENQKYKELVGEFIKNNYTQRWVGSLVADAHRTIIKGGFFSYPSDNKSPSGCLRLLYEVLPFCFIIEILGGKGYIGKIEDWKKIKFPVNIHVKSPIILCGNHENTVIKEIMN